MSTSRSKTRLLVITAAIAIAAIAVIQIIRINTPPPVYQGTIPMPVKKMTLADSSQVWLQKATILTTADTYPQKRELTIDGELFIEVSDTTKPLIVRTRLLQLTVMGKAAFRVIAFSKEDGEQVEVITGHILVDKAYESPFNEQDTLHNSQMVMINKTIDLMEREKFDATDLTAWRAAIK